MNGLQRELSLLSEVWFYFLYHASFFKLSCRKGSFNLNVQLSWIGEIDPKNVSLSLNLIWAQDFTGKRGSWINQPAPAVMNRLWTETSPIIEVGASHDGGWNQYSGSSSTSVCFGPTQSRLVSPGISLAFFSAAVFLFFQKSDLPCFSATDSSTFDSLMRRFRLPRGSSRNRWPQRGPIEVHKAPRP